MAGGLLEDRRLERLEAPLPRLRQGRALRLVLPDERRLRLLRGGICAGARAVGRIARHQHSIDRDRAYGGGSVVAPPVSSEPPCRPALWRRVPPHPPLPLSP